MPSGVYTSPNRRGGVKGRSGKYVHTKEHMMKIHQNPIRNLKISLAKKGVPLSSKGVKRPQSSKEKSGMWKGDQAGYHPKHAWNTYNWGHPVACEHCGLEGENGVYLKQGKLMKRWNIQWANISGNYTRERSDWLGLCQPCHRKYDNKLVSLVNNAT